MSKPIVYFCAAVSGDNSLRDTIVRPLIEYIRDDLKIPVLTEHIAYANHREILAKKISKNSADEINEFDVERQDISWLDTATHVIAEISGASTGVGREIEYARTKGLLGKTPAKILCLFQDTAKPSAMIAGMNRDREKYYNIYTHSYHGVGNAKYCIKHFLGYDML